MEWFVRKSGSDTNGGSSAAIRRQASDASTSGNTVTSATAAFVAGDAGHAIYIGGAINAWRKVATYVSATQVTVSGSALATNAGPLPIVVGGALLTPQRLLSGAGSLLASGDIIWIGAGIYRGQMLNGTGMQALNSETFVRGDVTGYKTGDPGEVRCTSVTTDAGTPGGTALMLFAGLSNLTFENLCLYGSEVTGEINGSTVATPTNLKFKRCLIQGQAGRLIATFLNTTTTPVFGHEYDSCIIYAPSGSSSALSYASVFATAGGEYDVGVTVKNCLLFVGGTMTAVAHGQSGTPNANKPGGIDILNCTVIGGGAGCRVNGVDMSTTIPMEVYGCMFIGGTAISSAGVGLNAQVTEDRNCLCGATLTNVTAGANSKTGYAPIVSLGQERVVFGDYEARPFASPLDATAPSLNFGAPGTNPTVDILGAPRPSGGNAPAAASGFGAGAYELPNAAVPETGTVHAGAGSITIPGAGYIDLIVPVESAAATFSIRARFDATYAGAKPCMEVLDAPELGITTQLVAMAGAADQWEQLSIGPLTPSARGRLIFRLRSRTTVGAGKAIFDTWAVN